IAATSRWYAVGPRADLRRNDRLVVAPQKAMWDSGTAASRRIRKMSWSATRWDRRDCMETLDTIRTLLAVRTFRDEPVPDEVVREIVEAAHLTASAGNGQPWRFVVVQDKDMLRQLGGLARTGPYVAQSQLAVVVCIPAGNQNALFDGSPALHDLVLARSRPACGR